MSERSFDIIAGLLVVAFLVSVGTTAYSLTTVSSIRGISGWATTTPTGVANVTVPSKTYISLPVAAIDFGVLDVNLNNDTTDDSPLPFTLQNDGTVNVNVTVGASDMFSGTGGANPSGYYQFKSEENEVGSVINTTTDLISLYTNMPATGSPERVVGRLKYQDADDSIKVHINVTVPGDEPAGGKTSTVTFTATQA